MFAPDAYETALTTVETLSNRVESPDAGDYRYLVKVTWEYDSEFYVIETPIDTESELHLHDVVRAKVQRDEGIARVELITRF